MQSDSRTESSWFVQSPCSPGRFNAHSGKVLCSICEAGTFSSGGSTSCAIRLFCHHLPDCETAGSICSNGTYASTAGSTACLQCGKGEFSPPSNGTSFVTACTVSSRLLLQYFFTNQCYPFSALSCGFSSAFTRQQLLPELSAWHECSFAWLAGLVREALAASIAHRQLLRFSVGCQPGTFSNATGSVSCIRCREGSYQTQAGMSYCIECSPGQYNSFTGLPSRSVD